MTRPLSPQLSSPSPSSSSSQSSSVSLCFSLRPLRSLLFVLAQPSSPPLSSSPFSSSTRSSSVSLCFSLRSLRSLLFVLALTPFASAQDLGIKAPRQSQPAAITSATIHTISGPDIPQGTITFADGLITGVYTHDQWEHFKSTVRTNWDQWLLIDAPGKHVYPGLVAPRTQLGLTEFAAVQQTIDLAELGQIKPEVLALTAINPDSTLIPVTRSNGILTAAVFPEGGTIPGRPCAIRLDAWTNEDMAIFPSPSSPKGEVPESARAEGARTPNPALGLCLNWPMTRTIRAWWMDQSEEDQQKANRESLQRVTTAFDTAAAYIAAKDADPAHPTDLRWEAMRAVLPSQSSPKGEVPRSAAAEGASSSHSPSEPPIEATSAPHPLPIFIAANDHDQIVAAVAFCKERRLRMVLVGGREADLCADLLKENSIPVIIGGTHTMPRRDDSPYDESYTLPARLHAAGVGFCIASADDTAHERNLPYNAAMAVAHGLPMDAALRAVTLAPAQILGIDHHVGSLDQGKNATLLLTNGNPLEVTTRIDAAFIDGRQISLSNKQTELYKKYRTRFEQLGQIRDEYKTTPGSKTP